MLTTLSLTQFDCLESFARSADDHHAQRIIRSASAAVRHDWMRMSHEAKAIELCVAAFNAMATRLGLEWVDGERFPSYVRESGTRYRRIESLKYIDGMDCMAYVRAPGADRNLPAVLWLDRLGRTLGAE
jgi:hypothetical protein